MEIKRIDETLLDLTLKLGALATIIYIPALLDPINIPKLLILAFSSFLVLTPILVFNWGNLVPKAPRTPSLILGFFVVVLIVEIFTTKQNIFRIFIGAWGRNDGVIAYLSLLFFLIVTSVSARAASGYKVLSMLSGLGVVESLYGVLQYSHNDFVSWVNPGGPVILTLGNQDFASAFLAVTAVATAALLIKPKQATLPRLYYLLTFLLQMAVIKLSAAAQGLVALALGLIVLSGFAISVSELKKLQRFKNLYWFSSGLIFFVGCLGLIGKGPLASLFQGKSGSLKSRYFHWQVGWKMLQQHKIFGVGIDSFGDWDPKYRVIGLNNLPDSYTDNAHGILVQLAATGGILLVISYLAIMIYAGFCGLIGIRRGAHKYLSASIFASWIAFQAQSMISIDQLGLTVWGWILTGALIAQQVFPENFLNDRKSSKTVKVKSHRLEKPVLGLKRKYRTLLAIFIFFLGCLPTWYVGSAIDDEILTKSALAKVLSTPTTAPNPVFAKNLELTTLRIGERELRVKAIVALIQHGSISNATSLALATTRDFPRDLSSVVLLASVYEQTNQVSKAVPLRKKAVELDPLNQEYKKQLAIDMKTLK